MYTYLLSHCIYTLTTDSVLIPSWGTYCTPTLTINPHNAHLHPLTILQYLPSQFCNTSLTLPHLDNTSLTLTTPPSPWQHLPHLGNTSLIYRWSESAQQFFPQPFHQHCFFPLPSDHRTILINKVDEELRPIQMYIFDLIVVITLHLWLGHVTLLHL